MQPFQGNSRQLEQSVLLLLPLRIQIKPLEITSIPYLCIWGSLQFWQWWIFHHTPPHTHALTHGLNPRTHLSESFQSKLMSKRQQHFLLEDHRSQKNKPYPNLLPWNSGITCRECPPFPCKMSRALASSRVTPNEGIISPLYCNFHCLYARSVVGLLT